MIGKIAALCLLSTLAQASIGSAKNDLRNGHDTEAAQEFQRLANRSNAEAQLYLGILYDAGIGVAENHGRALSWYLTSASKGYAPAAYSLGYKYENGLVVPKDLTEATRWYTQAAREGDVRATQHLAALNASRPAETANIPYEEP